MKKAHVYAKVFKHGEVIGRFSPETDSTERPRGNLDLQHRPRARLRRAVPAGGPDDLARQGAGHLSPPTRERQISRTEREDERNALLQAMENDPGELLGAFKPMTPAEAVQYRVPSAPTKSPTADWTQRPDRQLPPPRRAAAGSSARFAAVRRAAPPRPRRSPASSRLSCSSTPSPASGIASAEQSPLPPAHGGQFRDRRRRRSAERPRLPRALHPLGHSLRPARGRAPRALDAFLRKKGSFRGYPNERALAVALGIDDPKEWKGFKERVHRVHAHVHAERSGGLFER